MFTNYSIFQSVYHGYKFARKLVNYFACNMLTLHHISDYVFALVGL